MDSGSSLASVVMGCCGASWAGLQRVYHASLKDRRRVTRGGDSTPAGRQQFLQAGRRGFLVTFFYLGIGLASAFCLVALSYVPKYCTFYFPTPASFATNPHTHLHPQDKRKAGEAREARPMTLYSILVTQNLSRLYVLPVSCSTAWRFSFVAQCLMACLNPAFFALLLPLSIMICSILKVVCHLDRNHSEPVFNSLHRFDSFSLCLILRNVPQVPLRAYLFSYLVLEAALLAPLLSKVGHLERCGMVRWGASRQTDKA